MSICSRMQNPIPEYDAVVQLSGGFGNQLFQYAFGMQLTAVYGRRVVYDAAFYTVPNSVEHNRLRLIEYGFDVPIIPQLPDGHRLARRLKWLPSSIQQVLAGMTYVKCPATRFLSVRTQAGPTYFAGLWHSPLYFDMIGDDIRSDFRSRLLAAGKCDEALGVGTVGFHVRRGDYLAHKQSHNLDYQAYLGAAYSRLIEVIGNRDLRFRVFTDDPDWCEANLSLPNIEVFRGGGMLEDFLALMQCEHKIISNSTFAWWAAYLGMTEVGLVIAPKRWHASADSDEARILDESWIVVDY